MSVLNTLIKRLSPVKLYTLDENSNTYMELCAFSAGLEILNEELDEILRESFYETAETYGLLRSERIWGNTREDLPLATRRNMLTSRSSLNLNDFTLKGVEKIFKLLGVAGKLNEFPFQQRLSVDLTGSQFSKGEKSFIKSQVEALFPAHLDIDIVFEGLSWGGLESENLTFGQMEEKGYTWQEIDEM